MKTLLNTLSAAALLTLSASSFAEGFAVQVSGVYNTVTNVGNVSATADGRNARADINAGGIQGNARVTGGFTSNVAAGNVSSYARGDGASASINLGGIQTYR